MIAFNSSLKYLFKSSSSTLIFTEHAFNTSTASWSSNKELNKCSSVANSCFNEDAFVIARLNDSSNDFDSIFIPFLIELVKDVRIYEHNSSLA